MITFFDMFAGIGGFRAGLERAGGFRCIGHCEIDKHADRAYRAAHNVNESEVFYDDATQIDTDSMPGFDLLCAGFPCQAFSIAGKREGFADPRGSLFFQIARLVKEKRPAYLLLENVPGLLSHDHGQSFAAILQTLCELGYGLEWQVLNSKDFGVPQSRRRVYIVGYLDRRCAGQVLPIRCSNSQALIQISGGRQDSRVYDASGLYAVGLDRKTGIKGRIDTAYTLLASDSRGLHRRHTQNAVLHIKEATRQGYKEAEPGDSVNLSYAAQNQKRGRVGKAVASTLDTGNHQGVVTTAGRIRSLMPRECLRLQGFDEPQIDRILSVSSDTQAYKQAGNAVTVNVVTALAHKIRQAHEVIAAESEAA